MKKKHIQMIIIAIIAIVIAIGLKITYFKPQTEQTHENSAIPKPVNINITNQPTLGSKTAPMNIVVFEDLKCMLCRNFNLNLYPKLKKKYINTNKANYTIINVAFIPGSVHAAATARCIYQQNQQRFFDFVDYLYHHQGLEGEDWTNIPSMLSVSNQLEGLDHSKITDCVSNGDTLSLVDKNFTIAQQVMGENVRTPMLYLNGILVSPLNIKRFDTIYQHLISEKKHG